LARTAVKRSIAAVLDDARLNGAWGALSHNMLVQKIVQKLDQARAAALVPVINATGIILHTNLGRSPLAQSALTAMCEAGSGYSNVELDLSSGVRDSRYARISAAVRDVTGAADSLVVNNCAAAVLLILDTFAARREVIIARNQLIEIGGSFRLPEVLKRSGARLVEVGTTNKVYLHDYERALTADTALLMRTHRSNYRIDGFVADVAAADLAALGKRAGVPTVEDLGSGALSGLSRYGLPRERTVQDALREGVDLVAFSGDKLLGGPQAGIIVGGSALVRRLRANPPLRALPVGAPTVAPLGAPLRLHLDDASRAGIPLYAMLAAPPDVLP